jgi:hypothetical protein
LPNPRKTHSKTSNPPGWKGRGTAKNKQQPQKEKKKIKGEKKQKGWRRRR